MPRTRKTACGVMLFALCASALASPPRLDVWPPAPDAGTRIRLKVSGDWPDGCVPALVDAQVNGRDVVLTAEVPPGPCAKAPQPVDLGTEALPPERLKLVANGVHRIRFEVRRGEHAPARLYAFRLLYVGNSPDPGFVPEAGFWSPERGGEHEAGPGIGVQMEVQARTLSLAAYGYADDGTAVWTFGAAPMQGHVAEVELSQLSGGAGPFRPYRAPTDLAPTGAVHVELVSPSRATLWFAQPDEDGALALAPISMVRFRFAQEEAEAWLGRWVVLAERDDGYPTQRIDFERALRKKDGFVLSSANDEHRLRCESDPRRPNSPPTRCRLFIRSGEVLGVDFDHVALDELRGWTGAGQRIVALRLNRNSGR